MDRIEAVQRMAWKQTGQRLRSKIESRSSAAEKVAFVSLTNRSSCRGDAVHQVRPRFLTQTKNGSGHFQPFRRGGPLTECAHFDQGIFCKSLVEASNREPHRFVAIQCTFDPRARAIVRRRFVAHPEAMPKMNRDVSEAAKIDKSVER